MVTSPNYPGNYPSSLEKTKTIKVEEGLVISLQFTAFDIEAESTCAYDHLTITDGDGTTLMEKSCGNSLPAAIRSTSNVVNLVFTTDDYDGGNSGWSVSWSAVTPGECQQHVWIFLVNLLKVFEPNNCGCFQEHQMLSTKPNQALPLFPLLNLLSFYCKEHLDPSFD